MRTFIGGFVVVWPACVLGVEEVVKVGMIGLDTSHCLEFTKARAEAAKLALE